MLERSSPSPVGGLVCLSHNPDDICGRVNNRLRSFFNSSGFRRLRGAPLLSKLAMLPIAGLLHLLGAMIMTQDHMRTFEKARDQLLAQRRSLAEALAGGYKKGRTETQIERIVKVQAAIDVITSAVNQARLASSRPGASEPTPDDRWR
jgi:hypothetical protein